MINADAIREAKFEKTAVFGYKAEDVDQFLAEIAKAFETLQDEKEELEEKIAVLAEGIEGYREQEESLKTTLLAAQRLSDSLIKEAKQKADELLDAATSEASRIDKDTEKKRAAAEREINREMDKERKNLLRIQKEVSSFKANLLDLYKHHLDLITALPEFEDEEDEVEEEIIEITETVIESDDSITEPIAEAEIEAIKEDDTVEYEEPTEQSSLFGNISFEEDFTSSDK